MELQDIFKFSHALASKDKRKAALPAIVVAAILLAVGSYANAYFSEKGKAAATPIEQGSASDGQARRVTRVVTPTLLSRFPTLSVIRPSRKSQTSDGPTQAEVMAALAAFNSESFGTPGKAVFAEERHVADVQSECVLLAQSDFFGRDLLAECQLIDSKFIATINNKTLIAVTMAYPKLTGNRRAVALVLYEGGSFEQFKPVYSRLMIDGDAEFVIPRAFHVKDVVIVRWRFGPFGNCGDDIEEAIWAKQKSSWQKIDLDAWKKQLKERLPEGLSTWCDPWVDYSSLSYKSDLWRSTDAHASPTGGSVTVQLQLRSGVFDIADIRFDPRPLSHEP